MILIKGMKVSYFGVLLLAGVAVGQFGVPSLWGGSNNMGPPGRPPQGYGKPPGRPYPPGPPGGGGNFPSGPPGGGSNYPSRGDYNDDPIPPMSDLESSYDSQTLPSKLPILAPNGVVEIYNRVVDDLIRKLESDLQKKELDPMSVVIRATPPGPVRVPGYLQKRPFRRPGAALYRSNNPVQPPSGPIPNLVSSSKKTKRGRAGVLPPETRFGEDRPSSDGESNSFRGAGKISKGPLEVVDDDEKEILETTAASTTSTTSTTTEAPKEEELPTITISSEERGSSEEDTFMKPRSDEFFPEPEEEEETAKDSKKEKKKQESEEIEEEEEDKNNKDKDKDVDSLIQHYQSKNSKTKEKYVGKKKGSKPIVMDPSLDSEPASLESKTDDVKPEKERKGIKEKKEKVKAKEEVIQASEEGDDDEEDDDDPESRDDHEQNDDHEEFDSPEPGTGGGKRPQGGYYPPGGPPVIPAKPNAELSGLSKIRRASDVSVSVDARSAVVTARLLVGPINIVINDSSEPMEKNVKATIPELEAEILLMERHGVVFLQRFTLDRAYGQDVEISIPKSKDKKKGSSKNSPPPNDPNHPMNVESRRQTKMAAHISMEVVKLLRSGNLRVNLMRTAQGAMSKLKLPIKKAKHNKKSKKNKERKDDD